MSQSFLLVEPSRTVTAMIQEFAAQTGFIMCHAKTSGEAKKLLDAEYDFILLANQLDTLSGVELCRYIRTYAQHSDIPIKLISGTPLTAAAAQIAFAAGVTQIVPRSELLRY